MEKLMFVVASRPNFMKIAPLVHEAKNEGLAFSIFHTGQHSGELMSDVFFRELNIPKPTYNLGLGSKTKLESKVGKVFFLIRNIIKTRKIMREYAPDVVIVVGDVFSSAYATIIAKTLKIKVAHVEAGLRSFNNKMPEEKSRRIIDKYADLLFTTEEEASKNLIKEGKKESRIFLVGNVMIDSLIDNLKKLKANNYAKKLDLKKNGYAILTLHRHENINNKRRVISILDAISEVSKKIKVIFPLHPSTKKQLINYKLLDKLKNIFGLKIIDPLGYKDMLSLVKNAKFVITDSGGLQEETTYLKIPCLTIRTETERPITVSVGTNTIVGFDKKKIIFNVDNILKNKYRKGKTPNFWDGKASKRIIEIVKKYPLKD